MTDSPVSRIALGTVQFGMSYGVANTGARVSRAESAAVLAYAWDAGVRGLDTAAAYGESESVLGEIGVGDWSITSKLPSMPEGTDPHSWVMSMAEASLRRLRVPRLHALLLHNPSQLLNAGGESLYCALARLKEEKVVSSIGVSAVHLPEVAEIFSRYGLDAAQFAMNVFDRRFESTGVLADLGSRGVEVQIRSIFLQGLLLMDAALRPAKFHRFETVWRRWDSWLKAAGINALQACLSFAFQIPGATRIVLGVDSVLHLKEIIASIHPDSKINVPLELSCTDETLLDPWRWAEL